MTENFNPYEQCCEHSPESHISSEQVPDADLVYNLGTCWADGADQFAEYICGECDPHLYEVAQLEIAGEHDAATELLFGPVAR